MTTGNVSITLSGPEGEPRGRLRLSALDLVAEAEKMALRENLAKATALSQTLQAQVEAAGYVIQGQDLADALRALARVRRGEAVSSLTVIVSPRGAGKNSLVGGQTSRTNRSANENASMAGHSTQGAQAMTEAIPANTAISFFEAERVFPNEEARAWYDSLKGIDEHKERILVELEMLLYPDELAAWSKKYHRGTVLKLCDRARNRVPLVLLEGDVGTGKTALAETVGDALARRVSSAKHVHLLKINTQVRGTGQVGEMSDLIVQAFAQAEARARSLKGESVLLLLDEADALAASRDTQQMHHEDKAGLNTVLQRLDNLRQTSLPIATLFITNRPDALDPAVRRRAALTLHFTRPDETARTEIIRSSVPELSLSSAVLSDLVQLTGEKDKRNKGVPFTASDLTDRLLPGALREAFSGKRALTGEDLLRQARLLEATPPFGGSQ